MLYAFFQQPNLGWLWITLFVMALIIVCLLYVLISKKKKRDARDKLKEQAPAFKDPLLNDRDEMYITMPRNVTLTVGKDRANAIRPARYIVRNAIDGDESALNIRYNGLVKEFATNSAITLGEGDSICCVSASAVLVADLPKEQ